MWKAGWGGLTDVRFHRGVVVECLLTLPSNDRSRWVSKAAWWVEASSNVMAHVQEPDFIFQWNRRVRLNRQGHQFSWLLAAKLCTSAVIILDTPCSEVVWRVLATHSIRQFPLHFSSRVSLCAITFQLESTAVTWLPASCSQHALVNAMLGSPQPDLAALCPFQRNLFCRQNIHCFAVSVWNGQRNTSWCVRSASPLTSWTLQPGSNN
jgi:hypothetical protein